MAVHRLFPVSSTSASSASPTALRRSARLGSPCPVVTRKRARVSDSSEQPQLPSKLSLTPEPSPRSIRAQKRQKILDNSSSIETTKGKRKVADEPYQVVKKRKENIINDVLRPTTRKRAANNSKSMSNVKKDSDPSSSRMVTRTMKRCSSPLNSSPPTLIPSSTDTSIRPTTDAAHDAQPSSDTSTTSSLSIPPSMASLPISFLNVPLSSPMPLSIPMSFNMDIPFMNMPLSISPSLVIPTPIGMSTTLAPSESELGFGFQPQEGFDSTGREEGKENGKKKEEDGEHLFINGERPLLQHSTSPFLSPSGPSSSDILDRPSSPPRPQKPLLDLTSTTPAIPTRLVISTGPSDQSPPTSPTSEPILTPCSSNVKRTSPTYSSPLKFVCFPPSVVPPPPLSASQEQEQGQEPSTTHQLPTLPTLSPSTAMVMDEHARRMKEWDTLAVEDQRQSRQEMDIIAALSFGDSSSDQGLAEPQVLEGEQPLLVTAPQPRSTQTQAPYSQLTPPPCPPSPVPFSPSSSRQYHKKIAYQNHEWTPKLDKERSLWKVACKIRVWEITKRYTPDTIRTVVAQETHDYYSLHGFPLGYGLVPVRGKKRRRRKMMRGASADSAALHSGSTVATASAADSSSASSSMVMTPLLSPSPPTTRHRDDEFMKEETYSFELMDDDDDVEGLVGGISGGGSAVDGLRSMEDEWRYEGFEEDDEFGFEDYDDDEEDEDEDVYGDDEEDDDDDEIEEDQQPKVSGNGMMKKGAVVSTTTTSGDDQDQDPDAEGEMEIDIEPYQDPSFNSELSSPTITGSSKAKSKSKSALGNESQSFVSSFYIPPVPPHLQTQQMMHMQQQQRRQEERMEGSQVLMSLDSSTNPLSSSSSPSEGTLISPADATADHNESHTPPIQIQLPPAVHHPLIPLSSNILPLPPPRLDSIRVFILRQEMGGLKMTGRGTPADRRRGAIWGGGRVERGKREGECEREDGVEDEDGGEKRGRMRLMLDVERGTPRRQREEDGDKRLRLSLCGDDGGGGGEEMTDVRLPVVVPTIGIKRSITESSNGGGGDDESDVTHKATMSSSSSSNDQAWNAFLASLEDKSLSPRQPQPQEQEQQQPQQGEEGILDSNVCAADRDLVIHGQQQLLLDLDEHHRRRPIIENDPSLVASGVRRLGPPTTSSSNGMFMFGERSEDENESGWFASTSESESEGSGSSSGLRGRGVVAVGSSSGSCPSDVLALEGFSFPGGVDGSSTLSYALG